VPRTPEDEHAGEPRPSALLPCRRCGKTMRPGWVVGRDPLNMTSSCIAWLPAGEKDYERYWVDTNAEILWEFGPLAWTKRSRFPAQRCTDCHLIEFDYSHQKYPPPNP
jgi:hypothetical protein